METAELKKQLSWKDFNYSANYDVSRPVWTRASIIVFTRAVH
jgi:hypothetical protein